ncbi:MAG: methyltransferase domain-containing protein [Deltaproteobacteria bacterium]|nr:methyltransferase domain-containing protein [Deltaproteobacteria bacterium]
MGRPWPAPETLLPGGYRVDRARLALESLSVELFRVADPNALANAVDPAAFAEDERFPYWAEVWPSGVALATFVGRRDLSGRGVLELGCGVGLAGVAAALRGARVLFTDFDPDALAFAAANHALNLGPPGAVRVLDWREPPAGLSAEVILAADVLYERRFLTSFLDALRALLAPAGVAYVAEPGRRIAEGTVERLEAEGFERELHLEEVCVHGRAHAIWIHELRRPAA